MKIYIFLIALLLTSAGYDTSSSGLKYPLSNGVDVSITLSPNATSYNLKDVSRGQVSFSASIKNQGDNSIIIAHPALCLPANYQMGERLHFKDRHGQSEILLTIITPNNKTVILRDGQYFFDLGNIDHFNIDPAESKQFYVGWFFLNARGRWENDKEAATVFMNKGLYRVKLLYRNFFPKAYIFNSSTDKWKVVNTWVGEMWSNEVTIEIK